MSSTFESLINSCEAITNALLRLAEALADFAVSAAARMQELIAGVANVVFSRRGAAKEAREHRLLKMSYIFIEREKSSDLQKINLQNISAYKKRVVFHRKQSEDSDSDSDNCVATLKMVA